MFENVVIHSSSEISKEARIGSGTKIWQHCTILAGAEIGKGCLISHNVYIEGKTRIGNNVKIKTNVSIYEGIQLEDDVFIGPSVVFTNVLAPRSYWPRKDKFLKTIVKKGASIGANATIICGLTIGRYSMVGAGSVITHHVPDFALVYGVPAKQHGWVCQCGSRLGMIKDNEISRCYLCGSVYTLRDDILTEVEPCGLEGV